MVFCVHCATENDHEGKFCLSCGRALVRHVSKNRTHNATTTSSSHIGTDSAPESSPQPVAEKRKESEPEEKPTIPGGERIVFRISKLPTITKQRIAHALAEESPNAIVLRVRAGQSAIVLVSAAAGATVIGIMAYTQQYRWNAIQTRAVFIVLALAFVAGALGVLRLIRDNRTQFRNAILINPFYVICVNPRELAAYPLSSLKSPDLRDAKSYLPSSMALTLTFEDGTISYTPSTPLQRKQLINALNGFRCYREEMSGRDTGSIYQHDLLHEARALARRYGRKRNLRGFAMNIEWAVTATALLAAVGCGLLADHMNDNADDEIRWASATSANTASAFRVYLVSRPYGAHRAEAGTEIDRIYRDSGVRYQTQAGESSPGVEAVIAVLEYARATGRYNVAVTFEGTNQIPDGLEGQLQREYGIGDIAPAAWSFQDVFNKGRESKILQRIQTSFGKVIPGDVLAFDTGQPEAGDVQFAVSYLVKPTGSVYYPVSEEHLPDAKRHFYVGIGYNWHFDIRIPDRDALYQLKFASTPASLFQVAYQRVSKNALDVGTQDPNPVNPAEVYDAMAESAFEDFSSKLLSEVALK